MSASLSSRCAMMGINREGLEAKDGDDGWAV
jgi:hypothetical protein